MEQSDLDLLRLAPPYHLQAVVKMRRVSSAFAIPASVASATTSETLPTEFLHTMGSTLYSESALSTILSELNEIETAILKELVCAGGRANSRDLALYFSSAGLVVSEKQPGDVNAAEPRVETGLPAYPAVHPHGPFEQAIRHLLLLGFVFWGRQTNFSGREYTSGIHDGVLIVPQAVETAVMQKWHLDQDPRQALRADDTLNEQGYHFQRMLYLYWSFVASQREGLPLVHNGLLARSSLRLIMNQFVKNDQVQMRTEADLPHLLFIRLLLQSLDLLQERNNAIYALPAENFFSLPVLKRARLCYTMFLQRPFWNELAFLPDINVRPQLSHLEPAHAEVIRSRALIAERLLYESTEHDVDMWVFITRVKLYIPYLLFPRQHGPRAERYSSGSNAYGLDFRLRRGWLTHREGWHLVEGGFIRTLLTGPFVWLGLIDLQPDGKRFRLSSNAAILMSEDTLPDEEPVHSKRLIVQPNFEVVVLAPISEAILVLLDRFAERISLEHIAQYRITRASVTRAIQRGLRAELLLEDLSRWVDDIPQNVRYSLTEWDRQARRIELWPDTTLIEVEESMLLDLLFSDAQAHDLFRRRLSPTLAEVYRHQLESVQRLLWQQNYLPSLSVAPIADLLLEPVTSGEPQWHVSPDGLFQPLYPVLNAYLMRSLERFTEFDAVADWRRITPSSLQRSLEQNIPFDTIVRFLQCYCSNGLPGALLLQMKHWGRIYDSHTQLSIEHSPLLRLPAEVLTDLQADEELQTLLGKIIDPEQRLVQIEEHNMNKLVNLLRLRGFSIEGD